MYKIITDIAGSILFADKIMPGQIIGTNHTIESFEDKESFLIRLLAIDPEYVYQDPEL